MSPPRLTTNRECVVRDRPCGRIFGGSNSCFVASPGAEHVGLELELIKAALQEEDIEPYVAVEHFDPAKDIFCSKICTKIVESRLCVVILTGSTDQGVAVVPNPNVYYEYGLITAWKKPSIPVQRDGQELAFNIQSLDTVKYTPSNFHEHFQHALRIVLGAIDQEIQELPPHPEIPRLLRYYMELKGSPPSRHHKLERLCRDTPFTPFEGWRFGAVISAGDTAERFFFSTKLLYRRLETTAALLTKDIAALQEHLRESPRYGSEESVQQDLTRDQSDLEGLRNLHIVLVDAAEPGLADEVVPELRRIDSTLHPTVDLLSPDDMRAELDLA